MQTLSIYLFLLVVLPLSIIGCTSTSLTNPAQMPSPPPGPSTTPLPSPTPTPLAVLETINGSFRNQIRILERNMPRADSEAYVPPSKAEQADFSKLASLVISNQLKDAVQLADTNHYTLNYYVDQGDAEAGSYLLREKRPVEKGWGLYALRQDSRSNIIVEAPHPLYDRRTPSVALDLYRALDARALLIAGAHRNANRDGSADVAHAPDSIFQSVHESLVKEVQSSSGQVIVLQIHGFHTSKHDGYPQAVLGFGKDIESVELVIGQELEDILDKQGIRAGACAGDNWNDLCGTTNIQAVSMNGGLFIHIELDEKVRKKDEAFIAALVDFFGK